MLEGSLIGVFGSNLEQRTNFLSSVGKKSETEGIVVYQRSDSGRRFSFLDDPVYPEKIQGYARISSIADFAFYLFPQGDKLSPADGEIGILLDAFNLDGRIVSMGGSSATSGIIKSSFKGMKPSTFVVEERDQKSSVIDLSGIVQRKDFSKEHALIYVDRAFNVKGVGVVVLGFVLSGKVSVHDKLRIIPSDSGKLAEVRGIQISDDDYDTTGRGIRVGLSLKGVELKDLAKISWLDDGTFPVSSELRFDFRQTPYYKQSTVDRDLHIELNGELMVAKILRGTSISERIAKLSYAVPIWDKMPVCVVDLNSKPLRIVGGGTAKV